MLVHGGRQLNFRLWTDSFQRGAAPRAANIAAGAKPPLVTAVVGTLRIRM